MHTCQVMSMLCVSPKDVDLPFDSLEIPTKLVNVNQSDCDVSSDGVAIYAGILPYYGKAAPLRRNPSGVRTNQFLIDSKVVMVSSHHTVSFFYQKFMSNLGSQNIWIDLRKFHGKIWSQF